MPRLIPLLLAAAVAATAACGDGRDGRGEEGAPPSTDAPSAVTDSTASDLAQAPGGASTSAPNGKPSAGSATEAASQRERLSGSAADGGRHIPPGTYVYAVEDEGEEHGFATLSVSPPSGTRQDSLQRVEVDEPVETTETVAYEDDAVKVVRRIRTVGPKSRSDCQWSPPMVLLPARPAVGARWTNDSRCDYFKHGQQYFVHRTENASITATGSMQVGDRTLTGFVVRIQGENRTTGADDSGSRYTLEVLLTDQGLPLRFRDEYEISLAGELMKKSVRELTLTKLPPG